jgi:hypothetical protein
MTVQVNVVELGICFIFPKHWTLVSLIVPPLLNHRSFLRSSFPSSGWKNGLDYKSESTKNKDVLVY